MKCKKDCKHCAACSAEFQEDKHNIYFVLVCNKYDTIAESYKELLELGKAEP